VNAIRNTDKPQTGDPGSRVRASGRAWPEAGQRGGPGKRRRPAPWADLKGQPLDARGLSRLLNPYDVEPVKVKAGGHSRVTGLTTSPTHGRATSRPPTTTLKVPEVPEPRQTAGTPKTRSGLRSFRRFRKFRTYSRETRPCPGEQPPSHPAGHSTP
jgi:hypothetical protein